MTAAGPTSARADDIVAAARTVLARDGAAGLTMAAVAGELGIRAPSLYKHVRGKAAIEDRLVAAALHEIGTALHAAIGTPPGGAAALLAAYRAYALANPDLYRLATAGPLRRAALPEGLEDWAGSPFGTVAGDPWRGQALWAAAHGMVVLELDERFADAGRLDRTWGEIADGLGRPARPVPVR